MRRLLKSRIGQVEFEFTDCPRIGESLEEDNRPTKYQLMQIQREIRYVSGQLKVRPNQIYLYLN